MLICKKAQKLTAVDVIHGGDVFEYLESYYLKEKWQSSESRYDVEDQAQSHGISLSGGSIVELEKCTLVRPIKGKFVEE